MTDGARVCHARQSNQSVTSHLKGVSEPRPKPATSIRTVRSAFVGVKADVGKQTIEDGVGGAVIEEVTIHPRDVFVWLQCKLM